ncbi:MAG: hypothetical protein A3I68_00110 [Candidatus Melainabacteria bacterium RIFCSPLOWO2_02_FULL_35_15]|nr:MAG: hypothetical protein A3F80_00890 [Candidatus Melainabacteria bacterium RIFCSPLOWO2_12_FULL_35_11]OGI14798.1 MAG: hypothetical protein A3I68_00110 [Candidatus Melainabacteria bacterium RIFCSPLOWO2_02_FULL_35_15]
MNTLKVTKIEFESLDKVLSESVDKEILLNLDHCLNLVRKKSRALASSLNRCFNNARNSMRYVLVYNLGRKDFKNKKHIKEEELQKYLKDYLKDYFEKNDFIHYREFVRLLRACTIDTGSEVSSSIKEMYNNFFSGKRLVKSYKLGTFGLS